MYCRIVHMQMWTGKDLPWDVTMLEDGQRYLPLGGWTQPELADFAAKRDAAWKAACAKKVGGPYGKLEHRTSPPEQPQSHRIIQLQTTMQHQDAWDCTFHHWLLCYDPAAGAKLSATVGRPCQGAATWQRAGI